MILDSGSIRVITVFGAILFCLFFLMEFREPLGKMIRTPQEQAQYEKEKQIQEQAYLKAKKAKEDKEKQQELADQKAEQQKEEAVRAKREYFESHAGYLYVFEPYGRQVKYLGYYRIFRKDSTRLVQSLYSVSGSAPFVSGIPWNTFEQLHPDMGTGAPRVYNIWAEMRHNTIASLKFRYSDTAIAKFYGGPRFAP